MNMHLVIHPSTGILYSIRFGAGRINELGDACQSLGISRPLLVTDRGLADADITHRARAICQEQDMDCGSPMYKETL